MERRIGNLNLCLYVGGALSALVVSLTPTSLGALLLLSIVWRRYRMPTLLIWMIAGFLCAGIQVHLFNSVKIKNKQSRIVEGCVLSSMTYKPESLQFLFQVNTTLGQLMPQRYLVSAYFSQHPSSDAMVKLLKPGSCWRFELNLRAGRGPSNEVGFDFERWLFSKRVIGLASLGDFSSAEFLGTDSVRSRHIQMRYGLYQKIQSLTAQHRSGDLVGALAVGIRDHIDQDKWQVLQRTGTAHLIAISGLHVGLAATIGFALGRYCPIALGRGGNLHHRGLVVALLVAVAYAALAGFAISTVRALIMVSIWSVFRAYSISVSAITVLLITLVFLVTFNPFSFVGYSVWLSVGAVLVIIFITHANSKEPVRGIFKKARSRIHQLFLLQAALMLLLLPASMPVSGGISWASMLTNIIVVPIFTLIVVPLVLLMLCSIVMFPPMQSMFAQSLTSLLDNIWFVLEWVSQQPMTFTELDSVSFLKAGLVCAAGCLMVIFRRWPMTITLLILIFPVFVGAVNKPHKHHLWIDVLDVGQALAIVIQTEQKVVVYDTGNAWESGDSGERLLVPLLKSRGLKRIDHLIVSHDDRDHSGGALSLSKAMSVARVWVGESVSGLPEARPCASGVTWSIDGFLFEFLHPDFPGQFVGNEQSCVLLIAHAHSRDTHASQRAQLQNGLQLPAIALITGDLGAVLERRVLNRLTEQSVQLVVGAHHGSMGSSDTRFVAGVDAQFMVFSSGFENQWGMPRVEILERWQNVGTRVLNTADVGQIRFKVNPQGEVELSGLQRVGRLGVWRWRP